jgi:3-isopropylmalate/(R)-2-methylmalate dehydratase small subunit
MTAPARAPIREITGVAVPFDYSNVDTDAIFPVSSEEIAAAQGFGAALFGRWRTDPGFILNREVYAGAPILVAGTDFGIGSSRETAVWALRDAGFRAVVAPSFGDIFRSNCVRNGVLTAAIDRAGRDRLQHRLAADPGARLRIDLIGERIAGEDGDDSEPIRIDGFAKHCLVDGVDEFALLASYQQRIDEILLGTGPWVPDTYQVIDADPREGGAR